MAVKRKKREYVKRGPRGHYKPRKTAVTNPSIEGMKKSPIPEVTESPDDNPFYISTDRLLMGSRTSGNNYKVVKLLDQVLKLTPGDKKTSIVIPVQVCPSAKEAINLCNSLRRYINKAEYDVAVTIKTNVVNNKYINSNVWRLK